MAAMGAEFEASGASQSRLRLLQRQLEAQGLLLTPEAKGREAPPDLLAFAVMGVAAWVPTEAIVHGSYLAVDPGCGDGDRGCGGGSGG